VQYNPQQQTSKYNVFAAVPYGIRPDKLDCLFKKYCQQLSATDKLSTAIGHVASTWEKRNRQKFV
jgi:hypothetical protein